MRRYLEPGTLRAMTRRYVVGMVFYVAAFALAFLSPGLSLALVVGLALLFVLPEPGSRSGKPEVSTEDDRAAVEESGGT